MRNEVIRFRQTAHLRKRARVFFALCAAFGKIEGKAAHGRAVQYAHGLSKGQGPHHLQQGVSSPEKQDAGVLLAGRRSFPHAHDAHHRRFADRPFDRAQPRLERRSDRGDRIGARSGTYAVRPCWRAGAQQPVAPRVCAQRTVFAGGRRARKGGKGAEPHLRGARRHRKRLPIASHTSTTTSRTPSAQGF